MFVDNTTPLVLGTFFLLTYVLSTASLLVLCFRMGPGAYFEQWSRQYSTWSSTFVLLFTLLTLAGLPPFLNFFIKFMFISLVGRGVLSLVLLFLILILLSIYFYFLNTRHVFLVTSSPTPAKPMPRVVKRTWRFVITVVGLSFSGGLIFDDLFIFFLWLFH